MTPNAPWLVSLWQRLQRRDRGLVRFVGLEDGTERARIVSEGWQEAPPGAFADAVIGTGEHFREAAAGMIEGGSFLWLEPDPLADPNTWRADLEAAFGGTVHLLENSQDGVWHAAFGWCGQRLPEPPLRVLMVIYLGAAGLSGGSETQLYETLIALRRHGVRSDVSMTLRFDPGTYDLVHCFGIHHPDKHTWLAALPVPLVVSPIYWDFARTRGDTLLTMGILGEARSAAEASEQFDHWYAGLTALTPEGEALVPEPPEKLAHQRQILTRAAHLLPNGEREAEMVIGTFDLPDMPVTVVPNAVLANRFLAAPPEPFQAAFGLRDFILCAGRVEPRKNQAMLVWALRETGLPLVIVGRPYKPDYATLCRRWAGPNVRFIPELSPALLASAYAAARVHVLPSWVETPGLASLEAALAGCNVVVGNRAIETEYFGDLAYVCDPANWRSIRDAVRLAWMDSGRERREALKQRILTHFTWEQAAKRTAQAYRSVMARR